LSLAPSTVDLSSVFVCHVERVCEEVRVEEEQRKGGAKRAKKLSLRDSSSYSKTYAYSRTLEILFEYQAGRTGEEEGDLEIDLVYNTNTESDPSIYTTTISLPRYYPSL